MKEPNFKLIGIDDGEESQINGIDQFFNKIIKENLPKLMKHKNLQIQEAYRTPNRKKNLKLIVVTKLKHNNGNNIESKTKPQLIYKGKPSKIVADLLMKIFKDRRIYNNTFPSLKTMKGSLECPLRLYAIICKLSLSGLKTNYIFQSQI